MIRATGLALLAGLALAVPAIAQAPKPLDKAQAQKICAGTDHDECVVRHFKDTLEASVIRGGLVFQNYCALCHGREGKGDGRAARLHKPPPYNLTVSAVPREYVEQIVRRGGAPMGRGSGMPPWGEQLTDEQIGDVLNFLISIRIHH